MPLRRFVLLWIMDYTIATMVVYTLSAASTAVFDLPALSYLSLLFIPIATVFFSWQAYRRVEREAAHRFKVAVVWVGAAIMIDVVMAGLIGHVSPLTYLFSPIVLAVYGMKFLGVFVGAYLGVCNNNCARPTVATDMLSPHST